MNKEHLLEYYVPKAFIRKELRYKFYMGLVIGITLGVGLSIGLHFLVIGIF